MSNISKSAFPILSMFFFIFFFFFLKKRNLITIKSMNHYVLGSRGIILLTLVVHVLLIVISLCNVI